MKKRNQVNINELLEDVSTDDLLQAKKEGRLVTLPPERFVPDPSQPRKTFDEATLDELRISIEMAGQIQPILVDAPDSDGLYTIIAGERRWRAISLSAARESVEGELYAPIKEVLAIIRADDRKCSDDDELNRILVQLSENNDREQVSTIENAEAMRRVVDLVKGKGGTKADAAKLLKVSPGRLSKNLTLLDAPETVRCLSLHDETQDLDVLYSLTKAAAVMPEKVNDLIDSWRGGELEGNLREACESLVSEAKQQKTKECNNDSGFNDPPNEKKSPNSETKPPKKNLKKVDVANFLFDEDSTILEFESGGKLFSFILDSSTIEVIKSELNNR